MSNLEKYADSIIAKIQEYGDLSEDEIVRFIYLSLGKKIVFDTDWLFGTGDDDFGEIYYNSGTEEKANNFINEDKWSIICKDMAFILSYIGKKAGVNIEIESPCPSRVNRFPHVYNKVTRKDGKEYYIDLFGDLSNIHMNSRTDFFGSRIDFKGNLFKRDELEKMDMKLGYITKDRYYSDDYFDLLKYHISLFKTFSDKMKFLLENNSPYIDSNSGYSERKRYIFNAFNMVIGMGDMHNWEWMDSYSFQGTKLIPKEIIFVNENNDIIFFDYSENDNNYKQIDKDELAKKMANGLYIPDKYKFSKDYPWYSDLEKKVDYYRRQRRVEDAPDFE